MPQQNNLVVMAHGFADTYGSPWWSEARRRFKDQGYGVEEAEFEDVLQTIGSPEEYSPLLEQTIEEGKERYDPEETVLFTHSMGGPIARYMTENKAYTDYDTLFMVQGPQRGTDIARMMDCIGHIPFEISEAVADLSPGSEFMQGLNDGTVASEIDYVNIYTPNDPVIPNTERARLPEAENVENVKVGRPVSETVAETVKDVTDIWTRIGKDMMKDFTDGIGIMTDSMKDPFAVFKPENRLRSMDARMVGLRASQLYNASKIDNEDLLTGHITALYNEEVWEEVEARLEPV